MMSWMHILDSLFFTNPTQDPPSSHRQSLEDVFLVVRFPDVPERGKVLIWSDGSASRQGQIFSGKGGLLLWPLLLLRSLVHGMGFPICLNTHRAREQLAKGPKDIFPFVGCRGTSISQQFQSLSIIQHRAEACCCDLMTRAVELFTAHRLASGPETFAAYANNVGIITVSMQGSL